MLNALIALLPVFAFLLVLTYFDSYQLLKLRSVLLAIAVGGAMAGCAYLVNQQVLERTAIGLPVYSHTIAPLVEELLKASPLVYLILTHRTGFMVDAAIYGFAIGSGFSCVENIYYLHSIDTQNLLLWIVRGFGTAIMHGSATAIVGILMKALHDRYPRAGAALLVPVIPVYIVHALFNFFFLPPVMQTVLLLIAMPLVFAYVFRQSEEATRQWLGVGLDADIEILHMIGAEALSESNIGRFLHSIREKFSPAILVDIICFIRLHTEAALYAKGILMMREVGMDPPVDPEYVAKVKELRFLEKSIGKTGMRAISPLLNLTSRETWQLTIAE